MVIKLKNKKKSISSKILFSSIICLLIAIAFEASIIKDYKMIRMIFKEEQYSYQKINNIDKNNYQNNISYNLNSRKDIISSDNAITIDFNDIFFVYQKGRKKVNIINIIGIILSLSATVCVYSAFFLKLTKKSAKQIKDIYNSINSISKGDYSIDINCEGNDELAIIAEDINKISKKFYDILEEEHKNEASKDELITSIAHDLRTPITSIIGYLELIIHNNLDEDTKDKYINISYDKSKRLERLIEDLFTYTKFSFGQYPLNYTTLNLAKLMEQLVDEFYPQFMDYNLEYNYRCKDNIVLEADGELLARLFANLLSNSIKYGRDGKNIDIELHLGSDGNNAYVKITNYGRIIPKNDLERIFEKFYRLENSRSTQTGGTGLGLAIVRQIVELHKGEISVESSSKGTSFLVKLPIGITKRNEEK